MKLKTLLKESNAWDRKFGQSLPTLEDTRKAYKTKMIKHIQDMVKYSDRLGSDDINDLKDLLKLIQKIK